MSRRKLMCFIAVLITAFSLSAVSAQDAAYTEVDVTFENGDITLAGTLSLPEGEAPFPAVILVSGSGPSDRDESLSGLMDMKPFEILADAIAQNGIAVLRYDDRGVGESTGEHSTATSADLATDARAALDFLRQHEAIDPARVGLLGHSEGGLIVAQVAADNPDVAFVISMAGTAVPGYDIITRQIRLAMTAEGADEAAIEAVLAEEMPVLDWIVAEDWDALEAEIRAVLPAQLEALPEAQREALGDPETIIQNAMTSYRYWMHYFLTHDPAEDWRRVNAPVLALFGGLDVQVEAEQNIPALEAALEAAGNEDVTIVELPNANHLFQNAITGAPSEYPTLEQTYTPEFLPTIIEWLAEHVG